MVPLCHLERSQQAGFVGGTLTGMVANLSLEDLLVTVLLSALGALVSFLVSMMLRKAFHRRARGQLLNGEKNKSPTGDDF